MGRKIHARLSPFAQWKTEVMICYISQNELAGATLITCLPTLQTMFSHMTKPQSTRYIIKAILMAIM